MSKLEELREKAWKEWSIVKDPEGFISDPYATSFRAGWEALADLLGHDHYVVFESRDNWIIEHSLECRLNGNMAGCLWHKAIERMSDCSLGFNPNYQGRWLIKDPGTETIPPLLERNLA
jgi:hypothetical protein